MTASILQALRSILCPPTPEPEPTPQLPEDYPDIHVGPTPPENPDDSDIWIKTD